jgi:hypothetical protein
MQECQTVLRPLAAKELPREVQGADYVGFRHFFGARRETPTSGSMCCLGLDAVTLLG